MLEWEEKATPEDEQMQTQKWKSKVCLFTKNCRVDSLAYLSPPDPLYLEEHFPCDV